MQTQREENESGSELQSSIRRHQRDGPLALCKRRLGSMERCWRWHRTRRQRCRHVGTASNWVARRSRQHHRVSRLTLWVVVAKALGVQPFASVPGLILQMVAVFKTTDYRSEFSHLRRSSSIRDLVARSIHVLTCPCQTRKECFRGRLSLRLAQVELDRSGWTNCRWRAPT